MGVVHKLTDEVIQFIVQTKSENPAMSCRKLSEMVSSKFSKVVSKSSVNAVLKEKNLSGSVGRPVSSRASKKPKFTIPQERKQQLFGTELNPDLQGQEIPDQPKVVDPKPVLSMPISDHTAAPPIEIKDNKSSGQTESQPMGERLIHSPEHDTFLEAVEIQREKERQKFSTLMPWIGASFIHATSLHLGLPATAAKLFQQHIGVVSLESLTAACSAMITLRSMGLRELSELDSGKAQIAWALNGLQSEEDVKKLWKILSTTKMPKNFQLIASNEINQQLISADHLKITFDNNEFLLFDCQLSRLGKGAGFSAWPITRTLEILSAQIISNKQPIIIESVTGDDAQEKIKLLLMSFADAVLPVTKAEVINERNEKLAEFTAIPKCKKDFIFGMNPDHRLLEPLTQTLKWGSFSPFYMAELDQLFYFAEFGANFLMEKFDLRNELAKAIAVSYKKGEAPRLILISNLVHLTGVQILRQFLLRWPSRKASGESEGNCFDSSSVLNNTQINDDTMMSVFDYLKKVSMNYMAEKLFCRTENVSDVTSLERAIYEINGQLLASKEHLLIRINQSSANDNKPLFDKAIGQFNRSNIVDVIGKRILFI